jgi:hypothetical protein
VIALDFISNYKQLAKRLPRRLITALDGRPIMTRYLLWGTLALPGDDSTTLPNSAFLHEFHASDSDRSMHNHPWEWATSTVLHGYIKEVRASRMSYQGALVYCPAPTTHYHHIGDHTSYTPEDYHRVVEVGDNTWTLFVTGRNTGEWGFRVDKKHVPWQEYCK